MADTPTQSATPEALLFSKLVASFGIQGALALMPILSSDSSTASKAFAGGSLAGTGASAAGALGGSDALSSLGSKIGTALGLAGTGYNIYNTATNPNLSPAQKGAGIGEGVGGLGATYLYGGYGALPAIATALGGQFQKSDSPQIQGLGRGLSTAGRPIDFQDIKNPFTPGGLKRFGQTLALGGPAGLALSRAIGFNPFESQPTTGTSYRSDLQQIFGKAGLQGFNRADPTLYNRDVTKWDALGPQGQSAANFLGAYLGSYSPSFAKNPDAYSMQAANILGNQYGSNITSMAQDIFNKLQVTPAQAMSRFQSIKGLTPDMLNRLTQGSSVLFG